MLPVKTEKTAVADGLKMRGDSNNPGTPAQVKS
jgi:hypothetical protein